MWDPGQLDVSFAGTARVMSPAPEPASLSLVFVGAAALLVLALKR
jgi:hypothetical protein